MRLIYAEYNSLTNSIDVTHLIITFYGLTVISLRMV